MDEALVVGIAGASASGKTSLLKSLALYFGERNVTHMDLDGYHLHTREERVSLKEFPDEISANDFPRVISDLKALISGKSVNMPTYDHSRGILSSTVRLEPRRILFVEGLHAGMINTLANEAIIGPVVFLYPESDLRKSWKSTRDVLERGYSRSDAEKQIEIREPLEARYVLPQIDSADILVLVQKAKKGLVRRRVLMSPDFPSKWVDHGGMKALEAFFSFSSPVLRQRKFKEVRLKGDAAALASLEMKASRLHLLGSRCCSFELAPRFSLGEAVQVLFVLFLLVLTGERSK